MNMFARGVGFNKFSGGYKAGKCYIFYRNAGVLFKNIEGLFTPSDLVLKNIGSLFISARVFGARISLPVTLDQELKKVL